YPVRSHDPAPCGLLSCGCAPAPCTPRPHVTRGGRAGQDSRSGATFVPAPVVWRDMRYALGIITPQARKATSLIISLPLRLRNNSLSGERRPPRASSEPEATPPANDVILSCGAKAEIGTANWPYWRRWQTFSMFS